MPAAPAAPSAPAPQAQRPAPRRLVATLTNETVTDLVIPPGRLLLEARDADGRTRVGAVNPRQELRVPAAGSLPVAIDLSGELAPPDGAVDLRLRLDRTASAALPLR
jgi:hypothetical protein